MTADLEALFGPPRPQSSGLPGVSFSDELRRVLDLPLRDPLATAARLVGPLTEMLRKPGGTMTLRPLQALGLVEAHDFRGLLALLAVGEGKTLLSYLLPFVLKCDRAVLIVPASLVDKTRQEFDELEAHWQTDPLAQYTIISYELLSRKPGLLAELSPDMLVCDEVHALKDPKSACTKRVHRYLRLRAKEGKSTIFCGLSGTIAARSFRDWWHIQQWALLPELHPLPYQYPTVLAWCEALDEKLMTRRPVGELARFCPDDPTPKGIRAAFGARLKQIPSIIASEGGEVAASLSVHVMLESVPAIDTAVATMRRTWATPAEEFSEAADLWRHAREMANGFYYRWLEPGPEDWIDARREFNAFVRNILHGSRTHDTMAQVKAAHPAHPAVQAWRAIEHTFEPVTVSEWLTEEVVDAAAQWARHTGGLVWVEHRAVGERLEGLYGLPYFGEGGRTRAGLSILQHEGAAAVSQRAVSRGFNLQYKWHQNLILNMTPIGTRAEQLMGRTHRQGQPEDTVFFTWLVTVAEQLAGFEQTQADSLYEQETTGQLQKLCLADVTTTGALCA